MTDHGRTKRRNPVSTNDELRKAATTLRAERDQYSRVVDLQAKEVAELKRYAARLERLIEKAVPVLHAVDTEGVPEIVALFREEMCGAWSFRENALGVMS